MNPDNTVHLRHPNIQDGARLWQLVRECPPLELNSCYFYLILCRHFSDTCLVAEKNGRLVGFVAAYRRPRRPEVIFVWQIAVHASARGQGLGKRLLRALLDANEGESVEYITSTVSPSNTASRKLFGSLAKDLAVELKEETLFTQDLFPSSDEHEEEVLFKIGPLS